VNSSSVRPLRGAHGGSVLAGSGKRRRGAEEIPHAPAVHPSSLVREQPERRDPSYAVAARPAGAAHTIDEL